MSFRQAVLGRRLDMEKYMLLQLSSALSSEQHAEHVEIKYIRSGGGSVRWDLLSRYVTQMDSTF